MKRALFVTLPLILLVGLVAFFIAGMQRDRGENGDFVPSHMIGKPIPAMNLGQAVPDRLGLDLGEYDDGKPKLVNLFASWCLPCAAEAPQLAELAKAGVIIDGVAVRDTSEDLERFLARYGNPYRAIGRDDAGALQLALGASGLPESYLIAPDGTVLYQHIGDIRPDDVADLLRRYEAAK